MNDKAVSFDLLLSASLLKLFSPQAYSGVAMPLIPAYWLSGAYVDCSEDTAVNKYKYS